MAVEPLGPIMQQILACAEESLTTPVGIATIAPGNTVAWDDCCLGELWVRVVSLVGSSAMSSAALQSCLQIYQVRFAIGVIRCAHTVDDNGNAPPAEEMTADALQTFQDEADLLNALVCCIKDIRGVTKLRIEQWVPSGPQGGCVGGEWTATFDFDPCVNCDEEAQPI